MQKICHYLETGLRMPFSVWLMKTVEVTDFRADSAPTCSGHLHRCRCMLPFQGPTPRIILLLVTWLWQAKHITVLLISLKHCSYLIIVLAVFLWALSCGRDFTWVENAIFLLPEFFWGDAVKSAPSHVTDHHLQRIISNTKLSFYLELSCLRSLACDTGEGKELDLVADSSSRTEYILSLILSSVLNLAAAASSPC